MKPREAGYYWVRLRDRKRSHVTLVGRYIPEPFAAAEPWRVENEWFAEKDVRVISDKLVPPQEAA